MIRVYVNTVQCMMNRFRIEDTEQPGKYRRCRTVEELLTRSNRFLNSGKSAEHFNFYDLVGEFESFEEMHRNIKRVFPEEFI